MFDLSKRSAFQTVGDLRMLLSNLSTETRVCICGDANCFYHEERDRSVICLDNEDLSEFYEEAAQYPQPDGKDSPLTQFVRQEVPCRLQEVFDCSEEQLTDEVLQACVEALSKDSETLFNYDRIDDKLAEILRGFGIHGGDIYDT